MGRREDGGETTVSRGVGRIPAHSSIIFGAKILWVCDNEIVLASEEKESGTNLDEQWDLAWMLRIV